MIVDYVTNRCVRACSRPRAVEVPLTPTRVPVVMTHLQLLPPLPAVQVRVGQAPAPSVDATTALPGRSASAQAQAAVGGAAGAVTAASGLCRHDVCTST